VCIQTTASFFHKSKMKITIVVFLSRRSCSSALNHHRKCHTTHCIQIQMRNANHIIPYIVNMKKNKGNAKRDVSPRLNI
jgi:hypothetical protein